MLEKYHVHGVFDKTVKVRVFDEKNRYKSITLKVADIRWSENAQYDNTPTKGFHSIVISASKGYLKHPLHDFYIEVSASDLAIWLLQFKGSLVDVPFYIAQGKSAYDLRLEVYSAQDEEDMELESFNAKSCNLMKYKTSGRTLSYLLMIDASEGKVVEVSPNASSPVHIAQCAERTLSRKKIEETFCSATNALPENTLELLKKGYMRLLHAKPLPHDPYSSDVLPEVLPPTLQPGWDELAKEGLTCSLMTGLVSPMEEDHSSRGRKTYFLKPETLFSLKSPWITPFNREEGYTLIAPGSWRFEVLYKGDDDTLLSTSININSKYVTDINKPGFFMFKLELEDIKEKGILIHKPSTEGVVVKKRGKVLSVEGSDYFSVRSALLEAISLNIPYIVSYLSLKTEEGVSFVLVPCIALTGGKLPLVFKKLNDKHYEWAADTQY